MDISALSDEHFNAAEWINNHYKKFLEENAAAGGDTNGDDDDAELKTAFINNYVSKLQLYVQQVNFAVEDSSQQLVANMPRIIKEAKTLHTDVQTLQQRMAAMRQEVSAVQEETGECMATLERLNNLQTKLQAAKESLQESDGWGNLLTELEDGFERNDLQVVCEKLVALQKSLQAQQQLPGHADRQTQVEDFKNRLEALASPRVVQVFAANNTEQAQQLVDIFERIERMPQLQQYYRAVQKNALQQQWKQTLELNDNATQFLRLLYEQLLANCQQQVKWCTQVFGTNAAAQLQPFLVITELMPALQPTRDQHILQLLKSSNERLTLLEDFAQANHSFVVQLNAFMVQASIILPHDAQQLLGEAIFEYFYKFIQQYARLEETQLTTQVDRLLINQNSTLEAVRHLEDSTRKLFDWLGGCCERCASITNDLALCQLVQLLGGSFKRLLDHFAKTQRQLSLSVGAGAENWSLLQHCMALLQCCAAFQTKLQQFEQSLHVRMAVLCEQLSPGAVASRQNANISLYAVYDRAEIKRILSCIEDWQQKRTDSAQTQLPSLGIFTSVYDTLRAHFSDTHDIALNILLQPIEVQLANIQPHTDSGSDGSVAVDLPSFSYAPQECITQIGQYLLTLPQHLEPLLLAPSSLLRQALELCNIKYTQQMPCADILLSLVVEQCCVLYQSEILHLKTLNPAAAKQLAVDIEYLSNVLEELGLCINLHLSQILTLLQAAPENYLTMSSGCEPRLVTAIRQMRNIMSTQ